jgi:hypothetical protein
MRLGRLHGAARLEAACLRAERLRSYRYRTVAHILTNQQDRLPLDDAAPARPAVAHENVRGAAYYAEPEEETHAGETARVFWPARPPPPQNTRRASIARGGSA